MRAALSLMGFSVQASSRYSREIDMGTRNYNVHYINTGHAGILDIKYSDT